MPFINTRWFALALVIAPLLAAPPAHAAPSLKATADGNVSAHRNSSAGTSVLTPGPDSLRITYAAAASDAVPNDSPPPAEWQMEGILGGSGVARYGSLAGRARAEASVKPASSFFAAGGTVVLDLGFTDFAQIMSDSQPVGTPVSLTFVMTLHGATLVLADGAIDPLKVGAGVRYEAKVTDLDDLGRAPATAALFVNSTGAGDDFTTFEFDSVIGHRLELDVHLFPSARAILDSGGLSQGLAEIVADQTGNFFHQPAGDVRLVAESGHNYVPEPVGTVSFIASLVTLLLRRRKLSR